MNDIKNAIRTLIRVPGYASVAVITLAIGIGANAVVFSAVNSALLKPYPYEDPDRLAILINVDPTRPGEQLPLSYPDVVDIRVLGGVFEDVAVWDWEPFNLRVGREAEWIGGGRVSAVTFKLLGIRPLLGRSFVPGEDEPGGAPVVLLGEELWRTRFAADTGVVGRTIWLDGQAHDVIGVLPQAANIPSGAALWIPLQLSPESNSRQSHWLRAFARLQEGVTWEQARGRLAVLAERLAEEHPVANENRGLDILSFREAETGDQRSAFILLLLAVGALLLIVCANVANLTLARGSDRVTEMSVRLALGASRWRLIRQLLTENFVLAGIGCAVGLILAAWGSSGLTRLVPGDAPRWLTGEIDLRVVGFTACVALLAGAVFGLVPALQLSRPAIAASLRAGARDTGGAGRLRLRAFLVLSEVALAVALLTGTGLLIRSFLGLSAVDTGFATEDRLVATLQLAEARYSDDAKLSEFTRRLLEDVESHPETEAAAVVTRFPLRSGVNSVMWWIEGQTEEAVRENPPAQANSVSPGYFRTMGIDFLRGRDFGESDNAESRDVVIVNETLASRYWPEGDGLGERISFHYPPRFREVVGVVRDVKHLGLDQPPRMQLYVPYAQRATSRLSVVVKTKGDPARFVVGLREAVRGIDMDQALSEVRTLDDVRASTIWQERLYTQLFGLFGLFAVLLAALGIYGVVAYSVSRRTREIGVRMALGARGKDVARLVASSVGRIVILGMAAGLVVALAAGRLLEGLLFGISARDPLTYVGVVSLLTVVAALAAYLPARRAARIDPAVALRQE